MGGPSVEGPLMADGLKTLNPHTDGPGEPADAKPTGQWRRSVYLLARRYYPLGFLETFDAPIMQTNCSRRMNSVSPLQSLTLMNDDFVVENAQAFARRVAGLSQRRSGRGDRESLPAGSLPPGLHRRKPRSPERIWLARRISISKPTPRSHWRRRSSGKLLPPAVPHQRVPLHRLTGQEGRLGGATFQSPTPSPFTGIIQYIHGATLFLRARNGI